MRVGRDEDLDVYVGDWDVQRIELRQDADGRCQARWRDDGDPCAVAGEQRDGDGPFCWLEPFVPVRFGAVILCIGPSDVEWPSDAVLLERCFSPEPPPGPDAVDGERPRGSRRSLVMTLVAVPVVAMVSLAAVDLPRSLRSGVQRPAGASAASAPLASRDPIAWLRRSIDARLLSDLDLERAGDRVVVRGVLASRADVDQLNDQLDTLSSGPPINRRFVATPDIIDRLVESLPDHDLHVTHEGRYRFEVSGAVADVPRARRAIEQVAADLAEFGLRIDASLEPRGTGLPAQSGLLVDGDGTSVLRTPDGVKHIVVGRPASVRASGAAVDPSRRPLALSSTLEETPHVR